MAPAKFIAHVPHRRLHHRRPPGNDAPGGRLTSTNPAHTDEVVADVAARRRRHLRRRLPGRPRRPAPSGPPCPRPSAAARSPASAGSSRTTRRRSRAWSPARSASPTPSRSARCRRSSTPATSSSARAAGSTARPCRREMPDKQLFTFRVPVGVAAIITAGNFPVAVPVLVPRPGAAVRQRRGVEAGRVRAGARRRAGPALPRRRLPDGVLNLVHADGPATFAGLEQALDAGPRRQGRLHRLERGRRRDRRALRPPPADRRASSSAARTRSWSWPTPTSTSPSRARCSAASAPPASAAPRSARRSSHERVHDEFLARLDARRRGRRDRRPDARTSSTGR